MISSFWFLTFSDPLTIIGFALAALAALLTVSAALLLLLWRLFQTSKLAIRKTIPAGPAPSPFTAALTRYIIQQVQQFLDVETVLIQAEADYRGIYEHAIEGIFRSTPDGRYLSVNPTLAKMHGYESSDEMMTMVTDFETQIYVAPGRHAEFLHLINQQQVLTEFVSEVYRKDGSTFWVSENVQIVRDASGAVYYQGTSLDISDRKETEIELEALEIKLSTLLNASSSVIAQSHVFLDGAWKYVYFSPNCEKLFGYSAEEFVADSGLWMSRILPEDQEQVVIPVFKDILAGRVATMEFRFQHRDGSIYWISDTVTPRWDAAANCWVVTCVETNITSRKQAEAVRQETQERVERDLQQAEESLRQSEQRFRSVFDQIEIGMNFAHLSGNYFQVNPALCHLVGYSEAELLGTSYQDLTHPEDQEKEVSLAAQIQTGDLQTYSLEKRYVRKDGQIRWANVSVSLVKNLDGSPACTVAIVEDIDSRKQAEAALAVSEIRFRALTQNSFDLVRLIDHSLTVTYENAAAKTILGYTTLGKALDYCLDNIHPDDLLSVNAAIATVLAQPNTPIMVEYRLQRLDRSWIWLESVLTNWLNQPDIASIVINSRDITGRKQAEQLLCESEAKNRAIVTAIPDLIIWMDHQGNYLNCVHWGGVKIYTQRTFEEGVNIYDILPFDHAQLRMDYTQKALETGEIQIYEYQIMVDGDLRDEETRISVVNHNEVIVILRDITERKRTEAALRRSEARNRAMISAIPDLLICMDARGNYLEVIEGQNVTILKPSDGFDDKNLFDILPTDLAERRMNFIRQALATGQVQVYEQQIEVDRSFYDEEVRIAMISENEVLLMVRDISEAKRAAALLQRQANREQALNHLTQAIRNSLELKTIFSTAVLEISTLLQLGRVSVVKWFPDQGYWQALEEYLQTSAQILSLNEKIPDEANPIAAQLKQGKIVRIDDSRTCADAVNQDIAVRYPGAWLLIPLQVDGNVWGSLTLMRLETHLLWQDAEVDLACAVADQLAIAIQQSQLYQRVQQLNVHLEQEVQQRTAQLRQALTFEALLKRITDKVRDSLDEDQILQTAVDELGQGLQVNCCNAALYDLTLTSHTITHEYSLAQPFALGKQIAFADCPAIEIFDQLIQSMCFQFCFTIPTYAQPQGEICTILACPILDDQGILGDLWLYKSKHDTFDELEIRVVQQVANQCAIALRQSRLYQAAQLQVQELERLNGLKDDFLSTVSHELRTPMANIKMATQMLEISLEQPTSLDDANSNGDRMNRYLQILKEECHRETSLINDLLDLSRLDSGSEPLLPMTHHLQYWLLHIAEPFSERAQSQQQQLSITIFDDLPPLTTDFNYLEMTLTELLHNACKYTPPGEAIAISATLDSATSGVVLSIANSGVEIPETELQHVFDKFYRVPNNDPWKHGGTGLGLALVKKRVERLNGAIAVSSQNGWTTFTIQLPLQA